MATEPRDLSIIIFHLRIPKEWWIGVFSFPSICEAILKKQIFEGFRVNPKCLPDQVTYDVIVIQPYSKWRIDHLFAVVTSS